MKLPFDCEQIFNLNQSQLKTLITEYFTEKGYHVKKIEIEVGTNYDDRPGSNSSFPVFQKVVVEVKQKND